MRTEEELIRMILLLSLLMAHINSLPRLMDLLGILLKGDNNNNNLSIVHIMLDFVDIDYAIDL